MEKTLENSGGRVSYYLVRVEHPQREDQPAYTAECEDIIEALQLPFDEANIFKEIWRTANERIHGAGKEGNNPLRAAQKMAHYSVRILRRETRNHNPEFEWFFKNTRPENGSTQMQRKVEVQFDNREPLNNVAFRVNWDNPHITKWRFV